MSRIMPGPCWRSRIAGRPGETYCIGSRSEMTNLDVVKAICALLDELAPSNVIGRHETLIEFVTDRPGHDLRYAIDPTRISNRTRVATARDL